MFHVKQLPGISQSFWLLDAGTFPLARLQDQVGQSEIIPPANCNEKIFGGVD